jgi:hypothetical protein
MTANIIPGTTTILYNEQKVGIAITNLKQFQDYSKTVVDMVEMKRIWIAKNKR